MEFEYPDDPNRYQIHNMIGTGYGGAAAVYRATCVFADGSREDVAIKKVRNPKELNVFAMPHPNISRVRCTFFEEQTAWVVMPVADASMQTIMGVHPNGLPQNLIAAVLKDVCGGLAYLHSVDRFHGDLKPTNVVLDFNRFRISDTGVSCSYYHHDSPRQWVNRPYWLPPERRDLSHLTEEEDIYGLGILALELAYGRPPTLMPTWNNISRFSHEQEGLTRFSQSFMNFVTSCLHKDSSRRPTAQQLLAHEFFLVSMSSADILYFRDSIRDRNPLGHRLPCSEYQFSELVKEWVFLEKEFKLYPVFIKPGVDEDKKLEELQHMYFSCFSRLFLDEPVLLGFQEFSNLRMTAESLGMPRRFVCESLFAFFKQSERFLNVIEIYLTEVAYNDDERVWKSFLLGEQVDFNVDNRPWTRLVCRKKDNVILQDKEEFEMVINVVEKLMSLSCHNGSLKLYCICRLLVQGCQNEDVKECVKWLKVFKKLLKNLKREANSFLKLEKRITAAGGVVPNLA